MTWPLLLAHIALATPPLVESTPRGSWAEDYQGNLLPGRELRELDLPKRMTITPYWTLCADTSMLEVAQQLADSNLLGAAASSPYDALDGLDDFPAVSVVDMNTGGPPPAACDVLSKNYVIYLRDWSGLAPISWPEPPAVGALRQAFPDLVDWQPRLNADPQSFMISYDAVHRRILILGGSSLGAEYGLISFLRDSESIPYGDDTIVQWFARSVLDYPEIMLRISSSRDMNLPWETNIVPWMSSVVWNRFSHVNNETQIFASRAQEPEGYKLELDKMAEFLGTRGVRLIPKLLTGQTSMKDPGPLLDPALPEQPAPPGLPLDPELYPAPVIPAYSDEFLLGHSEPDLSGTYKDASGESITEGIHLTEGMRVPVSPKVVSEDAPGEFFPADELVPIPRERLHFARTKQCVFYEEFDDVLDILNDPNADEEARAEAIALHHTTYYEHWDEGLGNGVLPDCRDSLSEDDHGLITLCNYDGCPSWLTDSSPLPLRRPGLILYLDAQQDDNDDYRDYRSPTGSVTEDYYIPKSGHQMPYSTNPYDFEAGHVYALAIHYRQPQYLQDAELEAPRAANLAQLAADVEERRPLEDRYNQDPASLDDEELAEYLRLTRLIETGERTETDFERRVGQLRANAARVDYVAGTDDHGIPRSSGAAFLPSTGEDLEWATYVFKVSEVQALEEARSSIRNHYLRIVSGAALEEALEIDSLEVFELGATVAYPRLPQLSSGLAPCAGLIPEGSTAGSPTCTMQVHDAEAHYPEVLVADAGLIGTNVPTSRLSLPEVDLPYGGDLADGYYHTVLTPGLWPQEAITQPDPHDIDEDGTYDEYVMTEPDGPPELYLGQDIERDGYWAPYVLTEDNHFSDGFLGGQLEQLHGLLSDYPDFLDPNYVDNAQAYTESKGFNRSQGNGDVRLSNMDRLTQLHCRLGQELAIMGYDDGVATGGYTPGSATGYHTGWQLCPSTFGATVLYYGDMFTPDHNGRQAYTAPHSAGVPWFSGEADPFEMPDFDTHYYFSGAVPGFTPWWYRDDPEFLTELHQTFALHNFPTITWIGDYASQGDFDQGRGSLQVGPRYIAGHPNESLGAGLYTNKVFSADSNSQMTPAEQRVAEQVAADCMWNPRWSQLKLYEMKRSDFVYDVNVTFGSYDQYGTGNGLYYGISGKVGSQESVQLGTLAQAVLESVTLPDRDVTGEREVLVRLFVRADPNKTAPNSTLKLRVNGELWSIDVDWNTFEPVKRVFTVDADVDKLRITLANPVKDPVLVDALTVYEALPTLGTITEDGRTRPAFPRDIDEQALGWLYCDDSDLLPGGTP
ncbi:MAG: hypothetical protein JXX28_01555 [Deltaproteobacteria bacterium]|nr:hypothetical protein [Deltaproteobacteria bacterium]